MKVLFVFYIPSGGMETLNRQRCTALRKRGIMAECLYYEPGAGLQNPVDFPVHVTRDDEQTRRILREGQYDVIVVTTDHSSFERFRSLGFQGKLVLEIQGYGPMEVARAELAKAMPIVQAHASALLNPNTPHIAKLFNELYPTIPKFHMNNCFDTTSFTYYSASKPDAPIVAWIGRIEDNKNWREFLYIGYRLMQEYPQLRLWMFEDASLSVPAEREQFEQLVLGLGLGPRLEIRSNIPNVQMAYYYSQIGDSGGLLCSTSKVEGAPLSILEALSCRCPVLASNSDGVTASVIHNVTGKRYMLGDIEQAVRGAKELMNDPRHRDGIRDAGLKHLQQEFSAEKYCIEFMKMLHAIG
ncbi:glycosyltransferase family 4 protein [Paenibacillus sp. FSL K6-1230]|uniref:glycosyltransferase family 4 protein n=1 Tax=Paenibacillus sp. FSL K6-1230 TaxID=2921603 RepID=UPI0030FC48A7